jgi:hypothetical protein
MGVYSKREREMQAGAAGRLWETQAGDSASGKATNTRGGCSWRTSSRGRRGECRMCSREEDERLVEVEGDECLWWDRPPQQRYRQTRREKSNRLLRGASVQENRVGLVLPPHTCPTRSAQIQPGMHPLQSFLSPSQLFERRVTKSDFRSAGQFRIRE